MNDDGSEAGDDFEMDSQVTYNFSLLLFLTIWQLQDNNNNI